MTGASPSFRRFPLASAPVLLALPLVVTLTPAPLLLAAGTARWSLETRDQFAKGELENLVLDAEGRLCLSRIVASTRTDELSIWSSAEDAAGVLYFGSGSGAIYRLAAGKLEKAHATGESLVTTLSVAPTGELYVGTLPNGKIFRIDREGAVSLFCTLPVQHVWALLPEDGGGLIAATGPGGKLFRIDKDGKFLILFDSKRDNVLSLVRGAEGALLFGTAGAGLLYRLDAKGKPSILADFGEGEVRCIRRAANGALYCAVNPGVKVPPQDFLKAITDSAAKTKAGGGEPTAGTKAEEGAKPGSESASPKSVVSGTLWCLPAEGAAPEEVVTLPESYITDLALESSGDVLVATNNSGRVFRVSADGGFSIPFDFKEHQVLTLLAAGGRLKAVGTGDVGAIHLVDDGLPASGSYLSEVFDAKFVARWGTLSWRATGPVSVQTRSGNSAKPDDTWSEWSAAESATPAKALSPAARFLQLRATWKEERAAKLAEIGVAYEVANQRPKVLELAVVDAQEGQAGNPPQPAPGLPPEVRRLPVKRLKWKAVDPDGDGLVYWLTYRSELGEAWIPLNPDTPVRGNELVWNTDSVPDGRYVLRLTASDEEANARQQGRRGFKDSLPFLIDNRKPELRDLAISLGAPRKLTCVAVDASSAISRFELRVDDGTWTRIGPDDGLFDDLRESFTTDLPALPDGLHVATVRAADAAGNLAVAMIEFRVGK
ncbi:MAG: hypothetical protein HYZ53_03405 [Planctomycetes bacterium]|nr:hypothetical protein [Planctomycetota bacterium]